MAYWIFTRRILAGEPISVFHKGEMWRDFTYIDVIVTGVLAVLDRAPLDDGMAKAGGSTKPHAIYNIGNNRSEKLTDLIAILEDACGKRANIDWQPLQPGDVVRTYADIEAISRDLGYEPTTDISHGVPRFVRWYRDYFDV